VDPVPDPLLLRKSGSAGNLTRTSGSAVRNSDYWTTEAVPLPSYIEKTGGMDFRGLSRDAVDSSDYTVSNGRIK
jgi:hypothetical protein